MGTLPERTESALRTLPELFGDDQAASADVEVASQAAGLQSVDGGGCALLTSGDWRSWAGGCSGVLFIAAWAGFFATGFWLAIAALAEPRALWSDTAFFAGMAMVVGGIPAMALATSVFPASPSVSLVLSVRAGILYIHERTWLGLGEPEAFFVASILSVHPTTRGVVALGTRLGFREIRCLDPPFFVRALRRLLLTACGVTFASDTLADVMEALPAEGAGKGPSGRLILEVQGRPLVVEVEDLDFVPARQRLGFGAAVEATVTGGHGRAARVTLFARRLLGGERWQAVRPATAEENATALVGRLEGDGWRRGQVEGVWLRGGAGQPPLQLEELAAEFPGVLVDLGDGGVVAVPALSTPLTDLARMTNAMGSLLSALQTEAAELPQGCRLVAVHEGGEVICRLCGTAVDGAAARMCEHCGTPHHEDCWAYNGGCTVYACRGRPGVAGRAAVVEA